jgi:SAM-dependent methyltransferase|tara:strand:- start:2714 stop:3952 length:1239 start_codon:yes stop_codon:yes gene_type:complete
MPKKNTGSNCRSCDSTNLKLVIDLGEHAWCNDFLLKEHLGKENTYPLRMVQCQDCELCQLDYTVPKEIMFLQHSYVSGTTKSLREHFKNVAIDNLHLLDMDKKECVLDIGGNDGTQLQEYQKLGFKNVINIESAINIAKISLDNKVHVINEFFNEKTIEDHGLEGRVGLINASGVFFHLEELHSVIKGIKKALTSDGVFVCQFMYLGDMLKHTSFDSIYHEHLCYYSLQSLRNLLKPYDLNLFDAYHKEIHGGTIVAKFCNGDKRKSPTRMDTSGRMNRLVKEDKELVNKKTLKQFSKAVVKSADSLKEFIKEIKSKGHKVYAFGAPAKGNTLLTYCELDHNLIEAAYEVNDMKCGFYTPVTHVPIREEKHSEIESGSYILLLSWNFKKEILNKCRDLHERGVKFITPFKDA